MSALLQLEEVDGRYGDVMILRGVSLGVAAGEITGVIGANGAGKSSLLNAIAGHIIRTSGSVRFDGRELPDGRAFARARMGISLVPQGRELFPNLTTHENLLVPTVALRRKRADVDRDLALVHELFPKLETCAGRAAGSLSGGEQQMLAIGRALMTGPRLILLDEPSTGLSPVLVATLM